MANEPSDNMVWRGHSTSVETTLTLGDTLASQLRGGDVIALVGELGAGKTQLVRGLARGMGINDAAVASPTFVMVQEHAPVMTKAGDAKRSGECEKPVLVHIDAYRIRSLDELESIGWDAEHGDVLSDMRRGAVVVVEWADRLADMLAQDYLEVRLSHVDRHSRDIEVRGHGAWQARLPALFTAMNQSCPPPAEDEVKAALLAGLPPTALDAVTDAAAAPVVKCPICEKPVTRDAPRFPFCSDRCRTIDLGKWLGGDYLISRAVEEQDLDEE